VLLSIFWRRESRFAGEVRELEIITSDNGDHGTNRQQNGFQFRYLPKHVANTHVSLQHYFISAPLDYPWLPNLSAFQLRDIKSARSPSRLNSTFDW
jgi:hypothetical protein